ncbi:MAG TPA: metalloregulator ArsR/SmtB family transcription factor [Dissulfurispiraceae bacterium]|nr:metalloregulator ArsR/SmtB family transcription factor [Dissulfurispiraceae bacterium]
MTREKSIYELQAEICKILASPKRLEIITALKEGEKTVTEIVDILGIPKPNASQHLALMRHKGLLKSRREGVNIYYSIANPKVIQACGLMREVLSDILGERHKLASFMTRG